MTRPEHRIDGGTTYPPTFEVIIHSETAEPDTGEVKDALARMGLGDAEPPAERRYGRG